MNHMNKVNLSNISFHLFTFCFFIIVFSCNNKIKSSQNMSEKEFHPNLWANYNNQISNGRNQDALKVLDSIFNSAVKTDNDSQILKTFIKRNNANNFQEDALEKQITYIELNKEYLTTETSKAICSSILAELYVTYYQQNMYKLRNSTNIESDTYPESITDYTLAQLITKANSYMIHSLQSEESRNTPLEAYAEIIANLEANGKAYRNTIYDLLVRRGISHFSNRSFYLPESKDEFNLYQEEAFAQSTDFISYDFKSEGDSSSIQKVILLIQSLEKENQKNKEKLLNIELGRLAFVYQNSTKNGKSELYTKSLERLFNMNQNSNQVSTIASQLIQHLIFQGNNKLGQFKEDNPYFIAANELIEKTLKLNLSKNDKTHINSLKDQITRGNLNVTSETVYPAGIDFPFNIEYRNIISLKANVYKLSFEDLKSYYESRERNTIKGTKVKSFDIDLPQSDDFDQHSYEYVMESLEPSAYIVELKATNKDISSISLIHVSNIAAVKLESTIQVMDRLTGFAKNANIDLYKREWKRNSINLNFINSVSTDTKGQATIGKTKDSYLCHIKSDEDFLFLNDNFYHNSYGQSKRNTYLLNFTDRAIYRPGQTIFFKSILYDNGNNTIVSNENIYVELIDVNRQVVESKTLKTNEFGSINGSFDLPKELLNGHFTIRYKHKKTNTNSTKSIKVEEYKRPTYKITFEELSQSYSFGKEIKSTGIAMSYNQVPLSNQKVSYTIERNQIYRWYYSRYYNPLPAKIIANGEINTNNQGQFEITFTPEKPKTTSNYNNFSYTIKVKITDERGETRTQQNTIYVSDKDFVIHTDKKDYNINDSKVDISLKNQSGKIINDNIKLELYKLDTPDRFFINKSWKSEFKSISKESYYNRTKYYPFSDENKKENLAISETTIQKSIAIDSLYSYDFSNIENGMYKLVLSSPSADTATIYIDKESNSFIGKDLLTVESKDQINTNEKLNVELTTVDNQNVYEVESRQDFNNTFDSYIVNKSKSLIYPTTLKDEGGIRLDYFTYYKNRFHRSTKFIQVKDPSKTLEMNWETFRSDLYPGSEEKWRLKILDNTNKVVPTEFVASLYDKSLDAFSAENWTTFSIATNIKRVDISPFSIGTSYSRTENKEEQRYGQLKAINYPHLNTELFAYASSNGLMNHTMMLDEVQTMGGRGRNIRMKRTSADMNAVPASAMAVEEKAEAFMDADDGGAVDNMQTSNKESTSESNTPQEIDQTFIRTNLNETVFFKPELITNKNGEILIEFTMNEALTEWKFLGFGHTQKLQSVITEESVLTKKDLMVFPNGPRFFRIGDEITIPAKIRNMTDEALNGKTSIQIYDLITNEDVTRKFGLSTREKTLKINGNSSEQVEWTLNVPEGIESIRYQIVAITDKFKDGEEQTALVLENRKLVTESKVYVIDQNATESLDASLKTSNTIAPKNYTVSVVSNPSWMAVQSLPYLMEYRYKCTEQIFSRYFSNAIAKLILDENPQIEDVYKDWKDNNQLNSPLSKNEELKYALIEQSPWVQDALSEEAQMENLCMLFDKERVVAELNANKDIIISRSNGGGLPWFPEGRPNPYITQYILQGFGQLRKIGAIGTDQELLSFYKTGMRFVEDALNEREARLKSKNYVSPLNIHFLYTKSFFPELSLKAKTEQNVKRWEKIIKKDWLEYSLLNKGQLAIYFHRTGDEEFAKVILENLRQRSIYKEDIGRYWKETNGYNWYQSNLEAQAILMAAFEEIEKDIDFVEELKQWLLANKQTNKWNSTKSTTQAIYAILETGENKLANQDLVELSGIDTDKIQQSPIKKAVGEYNVRYLEEEIASVPNSIQVTNPNSNKAWVSTTFQYIDDLDKIDNYQETPLKIKRELFVKERSDRGDVLTPLKNNTVNVGDEIVIKLTLEVDRPMEFIHLQDSRASGTEPKNVISGYRYENGLYYYEETKDEATNFFIDNLPRGTYNFEYEVYASQKGDFSAGLVIQSMYAPEFNAHSSGMRIKIE